MKILPLHTVQKCYDFETLTLQKKQFVNKNYNYLDTMLIFLIFHYFLTNNSVYLRTIIIDYKCILSI